MLLMFLHFHLPLGSMILDLHILPIYFSAPPAAKRRGGPGGLSKICGVSPELQAIVGEPAMPRTQVFYQPSSFFIIIFLVYI